MGILGKVTVTLGLVRAEAGNEVVQGLGQRKARVPGLCLGWSGCGLPKTAVVSELASEDGARREKVGRAVPGEPSLLGLWRGLCPTENDRDKPRRWLGTLRNELRRLGPRAQPGDLLFCI